MLASDHLGFAGRTQRRAAEAPRFGRRQSPAMHIVQVASALSRTGAGVHEAVLGIATHLARLSDVQVTVLGTIDDPARWQADRLLWEAAGVELIPVSGTGPRGVLNLLAAAGRLSGPPVDIVHGHALWKGEALAAARLADRCNCPLVVSPHGMLEPWALRNSRWKKFLPWMLWERRTLASATLLQAMSGQEADAFVPLGLYNPVSIQPVGLDMAQIQPRPPRPTGPHTCLFLSRIHPKKGLPMLVRAWAKVRPPNWQLLIAGPDDNGHRDEVQRLAASLGLGDGVVLRDPAYGAEKWNLLASADLFVLPSYSENFGIVVAEAMAAGLPVITTKGTPWNMLQDKGVGWWVEPTEATVATALHDALNRPAAELVAMGEKAALIARQDFTWEQIARSLHAAYSWASAGGERPPCVRIP